MTKKSNAVEKSVRPQVLTEEIKIKYDCIKYGLDVSYLIISSLIIKLGVKGFDRDKIATSIREKVEDEYK